MASTRPPTWDPERFVTGIARTDEQHEMLFRMAHDFRVELDEEGFRHDDARGLVAMIEHWLANPICEIDVRLRDWADAQEHTES